MAPEPGETKAEALNMLDVRVNARSAWQRSLDARPQAASLGVAARSSAATIASIAARQMRTDPGLSVSLSVLTGAATSVSHTAGTLTPAAPGKSSESIVREYLRGSGGALTGLSSSDVDDLRVLGDSDGAQSGLRMLRAEQQIDGIPVFQSETRFLIDRSGRLVKFVGVMVPRARSLATTDGSTQLSAAAATSRLFASIGRQIPESAFSVTGSGAGGRIELSSSDDFVTGSISAREVLFPLAPGVLVKAWSLIAFTSGKSDLYTIVDSKTGDVLWRKNIRDYASAHEARFRVYVQADGKTPADSPAPQSPTTATPGSGFQAAGIAPTIVNMSAVQDIVASPNGWINDCPGGVCTANETQTLGNNVVACVDQVQSGATGGANVCDTAAAGVLDGNGRPTGNPDANTRNRDFLGTTPRDFQTNYLPAPQGGNPEAGQTATGNGTSGTAAIDQFRRGVVTHLFYLTNWYHDQTFQLGFDEAAGNFQQTNFSANGVGNDRVLAEAVDGSGTNNANFSTPPDGTSGRMQMYRFTGPTIDRDGSLDAEIVLHELTHGLSNRLVGNAAGLNWDHARSMGEGWSDFYALSLLNNTNADDPNGAYASGAYATYKLAGLAYTDNYLYGIRRFPYSTNIAVNPLTWADVDDVTNDMSGGITPTSVSFNLNGAMEVHNAGEIWANTLWGMRANIIADPAGANGDVPTGNVTSLRLVTNALKMTPINPSFVDARNALFDADCAVNACANEASIWSAFAYRGFGYRADSPYGIGGRYVSSHTGFKESFAKPYLDVKNEVTDVAILDSATNNNGAIDPGESFFMTVKLFNPWRAVGKAATAVTATLTTTTPGVTIYTGTATYGTIAAQASLSGGQFKLGVSSSMLAGGPIDFTLTTSSSLGTTSTTFRVRVGTRVGTDPVVTYTKSESPSLTIPNNRPRGIFSSLAIADDFEIADVDFRIDAINHPGVGDLTAMLRSPSGIGTDLITLIDGLNDLGGTSIVNMVIDDAASNDMVQAVAADAPYTKSWLPVYNSPWAALVDPSVPSDPVLNLSRYNGTSTKGTWNALVADIFSAASGGAPDGNGSFGGWSLLVKPVHFNVSAVTPMATVAATKTVSGTFREGGAVTYTVTLTNSGTGNQADNAGNEFTDVLPAGLTLVSTSATSGTAVSAGNTAT
ncbi:MAG: M36 family metallopeptidase, partial [Casimicrobium sp.]